MADEDEYDEAPEESFTINFKPSFVIVIIDAHPSMFKTTKTADNSETHAFKDALTACYSIADSLIFSNRRTNYNQFGIILAAENDNINLIEIEGNLLDSIKILKEECSLSNEELKAKYERTSQIYLGKLFSLCKRKFKSINSVYYKRHLIYITNDDDPVSGDDHNKYVAINEAKTFEGNDIFFELITMRSDFDYTKFYNELFYSCSNIPPADIICPDKDGLEDKLKSIIVFRYTKLRTRFYPFSNEYSKYLKVLKVNFIKKAKLINNKRVSKDDWKPVKCVKKPNISGDSGQYKLTMGVGEDPFTFSAADVKELRSNDLPLGLHLQYVSNRQLSTGVLLNHTSILIVDPKEDLKYFDEFWQYCVNNDKVLVCIRKYQRISPIRFVELVPKFANNQRLFLIRDLPFCDEYAPSKPTVKHVLPSFDISEEKQQTIERLIDRLSFDYDPKTFRNLNYARKKAFVKSELLKQTEEDVEDIFANCSESIDHEIGEIADTIKSLFHLSEIKEKKQSGFGPFISEIK
ncbi:hypothetical protein GWI33_014462 [Rhynchophorus ferrugineus]|uniref:Ku70/Ku80 N-terminal alpha/beta domain-containing protein n=1 Tax=Rhynchophorus ferrugineus TaxID=354439 RepID=A0A834MCC2_RHYFE|nr:hypothetical protein GWI33_014462 [Rhynchophorus ferrugineus]